MTHESYPDQHHDLYSKTVCGFWVYLFTDFMLFAALFAAYAVLHDNTFGGPSSRKLFDIGFTLTQTLILLTSTFFVGLAGVSAHRKNKGWTIALFAITFLLGALFFGMQLGEFARLVESGNDWTKKCLFIIVLHPCWNLRFAYGCGSFMDHCPHCPRFQPRAYPCKY